MHARVRRAEEPRRRGNCYVASEAIYHLTGGASGVWRPQVVRVGRETHWFLRHRLTGEILDVTATQFAGTPIPYHRARGCGFLTKKPSRRARALMLQLVWQPPEIRLTTL